MGHETTRREDGRSSHLDIAFDFLPVVPPTGCDALNRVLTLAVQYVLSVYGGASVGMDWCTSLEDVDRFSFLVLVGGECTGDYASRSSELAFIFRHLDVVAQPAVLDFLETIRDMWWVDGDDLEMHAADVNENWGDLVAGLQAARNERRALPLTRKVK